MRRLRALQIWLVLLVMGACSAAVPLALFENIPAFDSKKADAQYAGVARIEARYQSVGSAIMFAVMQGVKFSKADQTFLKTQEDAFLYHKSVAALAVYHDQAAVLDLHLAKAGAALDAAMDRIGQIVEAQKSI